MKSDKKSSVASAEHKKHIVHEVEGAAGGALVGAVVGAAAGPVGAVAGAVFGGIVGAATENVLERDPPRLDSATKEPDAEIGDAPSATHPPATMGTSDE